MLLTTTRAAKTSEYPAIVTVCDLLFGRVCRREQRPPPDAMIIPFYTTLQASLPHVTPDRVAVALLIADVDLQPDFHLTVCALFHPRAQQRPRSEIRRRHEKQYLRQCTQTPAGTRGSMHPARTTPMRVLHPWTPPTLVCSFTLAPLRAVSKSETSQRPLETELWKAG